MPLGYIYYIILMASVTWFIFKYLVDYVCQYWYRNVLWSISDSLNAYACILKIYFWKFVGDNAWGVPAQKLHFVTLQSLWYSGFLQSAISVNVVINAFSCTVKPVFKGHCDEVALWSGDTFSERCPIFPMLNNLWWRDICHVVIRSQRYWGVPWRQVLLYSGNKVLLTHALNHVINPKTQHAFSQTHAHAHAHAQSLTLTHTHAHTHTHTCTHTHTHTQFSYSVQQQLNYSVPIWVCVCVKIHVLFLNECILFNACVGGAL